MSIPTGVMLDFTLNGEWQLWFIQCWNVIRFAYMWTEYVSTV